MFFFFLCRMLFLGVVCVLLLVLLGCYDGKGILLVYFFFEVGVVIVVLCIICFVDEFNGCVEVVDVVELWLCVSGYL